MSTETLILIIAGLAGLGAFGVGMVLLVLYFRYNRAGDDYDDDPLVYGNLVQCPHCGYMNPVDAGACLRCRQPLAHPRSYAPPPPPRPYAPPPPPPQPVYAPPRMTPLPAAPAYPAPMPDLAVPAQTAAQAPAPLPPAPSDDKPSVLPVTAWLEGMGGAMAGQRVLLIQPDTLVGRSTVCDVQVYDPKVSRRHFLIRYANGAFFLQDQQSARGTLINKHRTPAQRLKNGDRIDIGDSSMVFYCEE